MSDETRLGLERTAVQAQGVAFYNYHFASPLDQLDVAQAHSQALG